MTDGDYKIPGASDIPGADIETTLTKRPKGQVRLKVESAADETAIYEEMLKQRYVGIRRAGCCEDDVGFVCGLFYTYHMQDPNSPLNATWRQALMHRVLQKNESDLFLLAYAGKDYDPKHVAGLVIATEDIDVGVTAITHRFPNFVHVQLLCVKPQFQRLGIGKDLLRAASDWTRDRGHDQIRVSVPSWSDEGERFIAYMGYHPLRDTWINGC